MSDFFIAKFVAFFFTFEFNQNFGTYCKLLFITRAGEPDPEPEPAPEPLGKKVRSRSP